ncbi:hypothetical protein HD554DRAFT_2251697 [Boletus coccyginus]|nr:hypothetical protein HD554DRAFT_2251697 [Boletus coccyginus]
MFNQALAHDGYQCVITGIIDEYLLCNCAELLTVHDGTVALTIQVAHILNELMMQGVDPMGTSKEAKTYYAAGAIAILNSFGWSNFTEAFIQQGGVHEAWNLLSLQEDLHHKFNALKLWFECTPQPGHYKICVSDGGAEEFIHCLFVAPKSHVDGAPMFVEFTSKVKEVPPPDPLLLAFHATCARVAHISGAAEFFDWLEWDAEETNVLAFDGSSAQLLSNLMSPLFVLKAMS